MQGMESARIKPELDACVGFRWWHCAGVGVANLFLVQSCQFEN
jgi:hypothetical protein